SAHGLHELAVMANIAGVHPAHYADLFGGNLLRLLDSGADRGERCSAVPTRSRSAGRSSRGHSIPKRSTWTPATGSGRWCSTIAITFSPGSPSTPGVLQQAPRVWPRP